MLTKSTRLRISEDRWRKLSGKFNKNFDLIDQNQLTNEAAEGASLFGLGRNKLFAHKFAWDVLKQHPF